MSKYLKPEQVTDGQLVPILAEDEDMEGVARLVRAGGQPVTFQNEDLSPLMIRQRWMIEWISCDECKEFSLSKQQIMTQKILAGTKCYRLIEFYAEKTWRDRITPVPIFSEEKLDDNFNGWF